MIEKIGNFTNSLRIAYDNLTLKCDKGTTHSYIEFYEALLIPYRNRKINLLEVGVWEGGSLLMWDDYFSDAKIFGIDTTKYYPPDLVGFQERDIEVIHGDGSSSEILNNKKIKNVKFDIIIDDANHHLQQQEDIFNIFYKRLKKNGLYIIEDVESTLNAEQLVRLDPSGIIIDRRKERNRFDDLLVIFYKD